MFSDVTDDRASLRQMMREHRRRLGPAHRLAAAESIAARLLSLPFAPSAGYVGGYWAMDGEIALHAWQLRLPDEVAYCLPMLHEDGTLRFAPWRVGEALGTNRYGIPEPAIAIESALRAEEMTMIVAPSVGFDDTGHRLGMGGGWYDRTLAFRRDRAAPPWFVGAAFSTQRLASLRTESWDVALDAVCTESDSHLFSTSPA